MMAYLICLCLMTTHLAVHALNFSPVLMPDASEEYTMSIRSPNLTLVDDNAFICVSADVFPGDEISYITQVEPKPIPGMTYHIVVVACDEPGFRDPRPGYQSVWDCGTSQTYSRISSLPRAEQCASRDEAHGTFKYQYQGGRVDQGMLRLPNMTGVPVGGTTGYKSLVLSLHFPSRRETIDGTTGVTGADVTLVRTRPGIRPAMSLVMGGYGFIGANSVSSISISWTLDQDVVVHPTVIYTHTHELGTQVRLMIQRNETGVREVILSHDPKTHMGLTNLDPEPKAMRMGDTLITECTYNNTEPRNVRVWGREMCYAYVYYYVDGNQTLDMISVYSVDPVYKDCFPTADEITSRSRSEELHYNGVSSFHGATPQDCSSPLLE